MLTNWLFDAVIGGYALLGAVTLRYLWTRRMPMDASVHSLRIPKLDKTAELHLESPSPVGVV